jgi:hypothetical protein
MRAAEVYRSITLLEPEHPRALYLRSTCLRALGRTEEALATLRWIPQEPFKASSEYHL